MFLFQKLGYEAIIIRKREHIEKLKESYRIKSPNVYCFDTETTGLNHMTDTPFLMTFGFDGVVFALELKRDEDITNEVLDVLYKQFINTNLVMAHNATYDMHMMINYGKPIPNEVLIGDSQTIFRLTTYADDMGSKSLGQIGNKYVDSESTYGEKVIKAQLSQINRDRKALAREKYIEEYGNKIAFGKIWTAYKGERLPYIEHEWEDIFKLLDEYAQPATYEDVYNKSPMLMISYALDDIVIMLEYLGKSIPVLQKTDENLKVFMRENALIRPTVEMERVGFNVDIDYILESRDRVLKYQDELYEELYELAGQKITVGQHKEIQRIMAEKWGVFLGKSDKATLESVKGADGAIRFANLIVELRTVDKWLSTYINGMLVRITNGRVYTSIDNSGAITGRVSSNLQQQPSGALKDQNGNELFHPRRPFLTDPGYKLASLDYSQQELRIQAYYTMLVGDGDLNLCRAYLPFKCHSLVDGRAFDYTDRSNLEEDVMFSGEWVLDENPSELWSPVDVHDATTEKAYPHVDKEKDPEEFNRLRHFGKMCNFMKNYGGGKQALIDSLGVDDETATILDNAYYEAFPEILTYQRWVENNHYTKGYNENLYGRRYFMRSNRWLYKVYNYMVQGSGADMIKQAQIEVVEYLHDKKSKFVMPIHDELMLLIADGEEYIIEDIVDIMKDTPEVAYVPMSVGVELSDKSWKDMVER